VLHRFAQWKYRKPIRVEKVEEEETLFSSDFFLP